MRLRNIFSDEEEGARIFDGRPKDPKAVIYAVRSGDHVKIGTTTNLRSRLGMFRCCNPSDIELLAAVPGHYYAEGVIHEYLAEECSHGEWFSGTKTDKVVDMMQIAQGGAPSTKKSTKYI